MEKKPKNKYLIGATDNLSAVLIDMEYIAANAVGPVMHIDKNLSRITFASKGMIHNTIEFKMGEDTGRSAIKKPSVSFDRLLDSLDEVFSRITTSVKKPSASTRPEVTTVAMGGGGVGAAAGSAQEPSPSTHPEATTAVRGDAAAGLGSGVRE